MASSKVKPTGKLPSDTFDQQLTATLKVKGVKTMGDLIQHYKSVTEAIDETSQSGIGEMGKKNYQNAKNMTLRFKKRDNEFSELKKKWMESHEDGSAADRDLPLTQTIPQSKVSAEFDPQALEISEIQSDKDLAVYLLSLIQEAFYNPQTGFWDRYDATFDRQSYVSLGKHGWEHCEDTDAARELINRKKNEQVVHLMGNEFVAKLIADAFEQVQHHVIDVKKREVKQAVRNHIRLHLYGLIYGQSKS